MKNNCGVTLIALIITIIVIVLIASITIYSGLDTVNNIRTKEAKDATNAIYLALLANEDKVPSGYGAESYIADFDNISKTFDENDFEILGLSDYYEEGSKVNLSKSLSGETLIYNFTYTNNLGETYSNLIYETHKEIYSLNTKVSFDTEKGVNRPIFFSEDMTPVDPDGDDVINSYSESWYNYQKNASSLALMRYDGKTYAWIPRFAYRIQRFYLGKSYANIPSTAIDIVFLREDSDYMPNNEVLPSDYTVHPAFENGKAGFWVMVDSIAINSISNAISDSEIVELETLADTHLMKNSEYAAVVFLSRVLNNNQINFNGKEFVAAVCNPTSSVPEEFDIYSSDINSDNYIENIQGHAMADTPWNLPEGKIPSLPSGTDQYIIRNISEGGVFYYETSGGITDANYRTVISE